MSNLRVRSEKLNFDADNVPIFGVYYILTQVATNGFLAF